MSNVTITDKLIQSYKQSFMMLLVYIAYGLIAFIVLGIGFSLLISAFSLNGIDITAFIFGIFITMFGYILFFVAGFASFIFAGTRGINSSQPVGFFEAYTESFKLVFELMVAILFAVILFIVGGFIGGFISFLFFFVGLIIILLFPLSGMFYVIEYLKSRT